MISYYKYSWFIKRKGFAIVNRLIHYFLEWRSVVSIAGLDCADEINIPTCRDFEIMGYPTLKLFPPHSQRMVVSILHSLEYRTSKRGWCRALLCIFFVVFITHVPVLIPCVRMIQMGKRY